MNGDCDARVAAAYEAAAVEAALVWVCDNSPEEGFGEYLAQSIRALTPDDAKAALEAVRREARNEALREAAEIADSYIAPEMGSLFYQGINSGCRAIKGRISALIDKETTE